MRHGRRVRFILAIFVSLPLAAQDYAATLARSIQSDVDILSAETTLARWGQTHRAGKVELAHFRADTEHNAYEINFTQESRWCAASSDALAPVARTALFYVPTVQSDALPPLPAVADPKLTSSCQLHAIWYQTRTYSSAEVLIRELTLLWGAPNGHGARPMLWNSGRWMRAVSWQRTGVSVWLAEDPDGPQPRLIAYAAKDDTAGGGQADDDVGLLDEALRNKVAEAAARIAGQDATLTKWMLGHAGCPAANPEVPDAFTLDKLSGWLKHAAGLSPERRAASLLVADALVNCADYFGEVPQQRLVALGATFPQMCAEPVYSHNFRDEAAGLAPQSRVDELAAVAGFTEPCSLKGRGSWMDLVIARGEKLLAGSIPSEWTPWLHYALAKAHAARLTYTYPGADPEGGDPAIMTSAAKVRERAEAIRYFRLFAAEKSTAPEAVLAWYQGWRLLAGLPPPPIHFGCGCE
jgi:hypothetical protein